jgi:hypothetical protein
MKMTDLAQYKVQAWTFLRMEMSHFNLKEKSSCSVEKLSTSQGRYQSVNVDPLVWCVI